MTQGLEVVGVRAVVAGFNDYVRKTAQIQRSTDKMAGGVAKSGGSFKASARRIAEFSTAMLGVDVGLRTVNQAFRSTIGASIGFESAFAGVRKTVDATEEEFDALETGLRNMAKEIPLSVNGIAAIAEAAGQLGIETENILGFTETMAMLGETTNLSADQAATSLARLANITQLPQDQFSNLGSTIVALGNNFATTEAEITAFGLRIAGAGTQIGLTQAEILAFGTALSSVGINAEAGGTAISRVFVEIDKAVRTGGESLANFAKVAGVTADEFVKAYQTDAAGAITSFIEGLGKISAAGGDTFAVLETLELDSIRVRDALLRASGAGGLLRDALDLSGKAFAENTALQAEFAQRAETSAAQFQVLKNRVNDLGISVGDKLVPPLLEGATALTGMIEAMAQLAPLLPTVAAAVGALVAVLAVQKLFAFAQGIIAMSQAAGTAVLAGGPLLALIAGVVALDLALRAITGDGLLENVANGLKRIFGDQASIEGSQKALEAWNAQLAVAGEGITNLEIATGLLDSAIADFEEDAGIAATTTGEFWKSMAKGELFTKRFNDQLLGSDRRLFGLNVGMSEAQDRFKDLEAAVRLAAQQMVANDASVEQLIEAYRKLPPELRDVFDEVTGVEAIMGQLSRKNFEAITSGDFLRGMLGNLVVVARDAALAISGTGDDVTEFADKVAGTFSVIATFGERLRELANIGKTEVQKAFSDLASAKGPIDFFDKALAVFEAAVPEFEKAGKDAAKAAAKGLSSGGKAVVAEAKAVASDAIGIFVGTMLQTRIWRNLAEEIGAAGANTMQAFQAAVVAKTEETGEALAIALQAMFDHAESIGRPLSEDAARAIMDALATGIELGTPEAVAAAEAAVRALGETFEQGAKTALEIFQETLGAIQADRQLEEQFGRKGANIIQALRDAMEPGGQAAAADVGRMADALVGVLADKLSPRRAGEIGQRLFSALTAALTVGGDAVLAELNAILAEINRLLGDDGEGARRPGGGGSQGRTTPTIDIPGVASRPGLTIPQIAAIAAQGGPAVREAIASLEAGVFTFVALQEQLPGIAQAVVDALTRLGKGVPSGVLPDERVTGGTAGVNVGDPVATAPPPPPGGATNGSGDITVAVDVSNSTFNGTPDENGAAIAAEVDAILTDQQGTGAFNAGVT